MLCMICLRMLRGSAGQQWFGTYDLSFQHHSSTDTIRRSKQAGCSICTALAKDVRHEVDLLEDETFSITANLSVVTSTDIHETTYRLDFVYNRKLIRTFVLVPAYSGRIMQHQLRTATTQPSAMFSNHDGSRWLRTTKSSDTSSDEVFQLVNSWISRCNAKCDCARSIAVPKQIWYPKRLIDLGQFKSANVLQKLGGLAFFEGNSNLQQARVKLVEPSVLDIGNTEDKFYVTLSHCWGTPKSAQAQIKLTTQTEMEFKTEGIKFHKLPKSFQHAVLFASRLKNVGYIWIDSLCIKQRLSDPRADNEDSENDWLEQSRVMDQIYSQAYLNISATAATDGDMGLFFTRRPEELWEDEINLNITGLIGPSDLHRADSPLSHEAPALDSVHQLPATSHHFRLRRDRSEDDYLEAEIRRYKRRRTLTEGPFDIPTVEEQTGAECLERCFITDVSFWNDLVEQAPVNRRAWVLQERLLAPRVLHFCHNQVVWECAGFQDAEGILEGLSPLSTRLGDVVTEGRLKSLTKEVGLRLRAMRLRDFQDPDENLDNLHIYELWKRVVEVYTKTSLTMSRDKLIALSGIARHFHQWTQCDYIAGLWSDHLESQLLWHVNEVFRDGEFKNDSRRDPLRAPSFTWASIDAPNGITYGEATDYKDDPNHLLFKVEFRRLWPTDPENDFGLVDKGQIVIAPKFLRRIKLRRLQSPQVLSYCWYLADDSQVDGPWCKARPEYYNLYLDAPVTDLEVFGEDAPLYCMPAAFGERTVKKSSRYLICLLLLLQSKKGGYMHMRRVGLTKLSSHIDANGQKELLKERYEGKNIYIE